MLEQYRRPKEERKKIDGGEMTWSHISQWCHTPNLGLHNVNLYSFPQREKISPYTTIPKFMLWSLVVPHSYSLLHHLPAARSWLSSSLGSTVTGAGVGVSGGVARNHACVLWFAGVRTAGRATRAWASPWTYGGGGGENHGRLKAKNHKFSLSLY